MAYKILADLIVVAHLAWILFMLWGCILTVRGFFHTAFFERRLFRTVHFCGIVYVALLAMLGKYCPLTVAENALRRTYDPGLTYPGSFMVHYIEKIVYPNVPQFILLIPTVAIAVFTVVMFIIRPPRKIRPRT